LPQDSSPPCFQNSRLDRQDRLGQHFLQEFDRRSRRACFGLRMKFWLGTTLIQDAFAREAMARITVDINFPICLGPTNLLPKRSQLVERRDRVGIPPCRTRMFARTVLRCADNGALKMRSETTPRNGAAVVGDRLQRAVNSIETSTKSRLSPLPDWRLLEGVYRMPP